jgi:hypothetical protein
MKGDAPRPSKTRITTTTTTTTTKRRREAKKKREKKKSNAQVEGQKKKFGTNVNAISVE